MHFLDHYSYNNTPAVLRMELGSSLLVLRVVILWVWEHQQVTTRQAKVQT